MAAGFGVRKRNMTDFKPDYSSFLLRLWREPQPGAEGRATSGEWLVQLEHIPSGEQRYFASLEECFAFIRAQAAGASARPGGAG